MASELAWQSKETEKLIRKNDKLMGENASLKRELSLHKQVRPTPPCPFALTHAQPSLSA